ncbi:MAG: hypothetical protein QXE86_02145 [Archaeoglobaceae archaeon]
MSSNSSSKQRQRSVFCGKVEEIRELLKKQFNADVDLKFFFGGKNRIYAYKNCEFKGKKGIYFGTLEKDGIRLSIEGSFIVGRVAKSGIIEFDEEKALRWLKGEDLEVQKDLKGYYIVKWGNYFLGCGKASNGIIRNYVPKDRRIKNSNSESDP